MESFERSIGPQADVKEIEYVAALQQTCPGYTHPSGTVSSLDILRYLKSRYSLDISHAQARDIVLGLGGGILSQEVRKGVAELAAEKLRSEKANAATVEMARERWKNLGSIQKPKKREMETSENIDDDDEEEEEALLLAEMMNPKLLYLDMVELVSVLFIPTISRYANEWNKKNTDDDDAAKMASSGQEEKDSVGRFQNRSSNERLSSGLLLPDQHNVTSTRYTAQNMSSQTGTDDAQTSRTILLLSEKMRVDLSPKPDGMLEFVLTRMWSQLRQLSKENIMSKKDTGDNSDDDNKNCSFFFHDPLVGEEAPMVVNAEMVRALLMFHGENERANDEGLVQRMVKALKSPSGRFDEEAFVNALSADLSDWEVGVEDRTSTCFYDVFGKEDVLETKFNQHSQAPIETPAASSSKDAATYEGPLVATVRSGNGSTEEETKQCDDAEADDSAAYRKQEGVSDTIVKDEEEVIITQSMSCQIIDTTKDGFGSTLVLLLVWLTYICHASIYSSLVLSTGAFEVDCDDRTMGCMLSGTIVSW
jgi:hypothetical protein